MAIFEIDNGKTKRVRLSEFKIEKDLQRLVEENLETIFNCRLIATEYSTGNIHSGRIDTLAIVCLQTFKRKLRLYLKLNPEQINPVPKQGRDVRNIGHDGTGDFELTIEDMTDFEETKQLINESYKNIGG